MCDVGLGMGAFGMFTKAFGVSQEVSASNQAAEYNSKVAEQNAGIARANAEMYKQQAAYATSRGQIEEKQQRMRTSKMVGEQRAAAAASGVAVNSGSPLALQEETLRYGEDDALTIRQNAAMEAWGYNMKSWNSEQQAGLFEQESEFSKSKKRSAFLPVTTSLLTSGSSLYKKFGGKVK